MLSARLRRFLAEERAAVTVDWVVLTAMLCTFALMMVLGTVQATEHVGEEIGASLETAEINLTWPE